MPAAKQKLRFPENRNQLYKQNTRQLSITRPDRKGGFGLGPPLPIYFLSTIATQGSFGIWYLNKNTIIQSHQTLTIPAGQILYLYSDNNNPTPTPYSLTNHGTIIIVADTSWIVALNSPYPFINTGTIYIKGVLSIVPTLQTQTVIINSGAINVQPGGSIIFSGIFTNNGVTTNKGNSISIGYGGNGTLTNYGTITNQKGGTISIGVQYSGTFTNQLGGTVTNNGTITKVPGLSTFTNNGTYNGPVPVPV